MMDLQAVEQRIATLESRLSLMESRPLFNNLVAGGSGIQPTKISATLNAGQTAVLFSGNTNLQEDIQDIHAAMLSFDFTPAGALVYANGTGFSVTGVGTTGQIPRSLGSSGIGFSTATITPGGVIVAGTYNGQTISSAASFTGTLATVGAISATATTAHSSIIGSLSTDYIFGVKNNAAAASRPFGFRIWIPTPSSTTTDPMFLITDGTNNQFKIDSVGNQTTLGTLTVSGAAIFTGNGAVGAPAYSFSGDPDSGMYHNTSGASRVLIGVDGGEIARFGAGLSQFTGDIYVSAIINADGVSMLYSNSDFFIGASTGTAKRIVISGGSSEEDVASGAFIALSGNTHAGLGSVSIAAGNVTGGVIVLKTDAGLNRLRVNKNGTIDMLTASMELTLGDGADPGSGGVIWRMKGTAGGGGQSEIRSTRQAAGQGYAEINMYAASAGTSAERLRVDSPTTATQTALMLYDVDNGTLERVTVGAADSGGAGFKVLRIPN